MSECQRGEGAGWPHEESGAWRIGLPDGYPSVTVRVDVTDSHAIQSYTIHICGNPWKNWTFLRLVTADGIEGVGECSLNGFAKTTVTCIEELSRYFLGKRPEEYATITHRMLTDLYSDAGQLHRGVIAAVEMACLDILGKRAGLPVYALLGGKVQEETETYGNGWYRVAHSVEGFRLALSKPEMEQYLILKVDPFGSRTSPMWEKDATPVRIIQELGGSPFRRFALECHQRLDFLDAAALVRILSPRWIWIEEPLPWWDTDGLVSLADFSPIPIATGENFTDLRQFQAIVAQTKNIVLQPDVMNLGGLTQALAVCRLAERYGLRVCPHDAQGPVSRATCVQLAALSPAVLMLEDFDPWNAPWTREIATTFRAERGVIGFKEMPPGLGVTIHWEKVREHPYDPNGWVPLFEAGWERRRDKGEGA